MTAPRSYRVKVRCREKRHPLVGVWKGMIARCHDPRNHGFKSYGAKGIIVCDEWRKSYEAFYQWTAVNRWMRGYDIDRRDKNGNYCPENCQCLTRSKHRQKTQAERNRKD